nr:MAG: hypothetical protein [brine shrimp yue-like virus 4]
MSQLPPVEKIDEIIKDPTTGDPGVDSVEPRIEGVPEPNPLGDPLSGGDSPSTVESNPSFDSDNEAYLQKLAVREKKRDKRRQEKIAAKEEKKRLSNPGGKGKGSAYAEHVKKLEEERARKEKERSKPSTQPPKEPLDRTMGYPGMFDNPLESKIDDNKFKKYEEYFSVAEVGGVPHLLDATITTDLNVVLSGWGADTDTKGSVLVAFLIAAARFECLGLPVDGDINAPLKYKYNNKAQIEIVAAEDALKDVPNDPKGQWFKTTVSSLKRARTWTIELSACHQIKVLKASNIENYFRSLYDTPCSAGTMLTIVKAIAPKFDPIMKDPRLRKYVNNSIFIDYHTTAASSAGIIKRFIDENAKLLPFFLLEGERELVVEALRYSWSMEIQSAIPIELIAVAKAYLQANDITINNWYQGMKATSVVPAIRYNQWVKFFKKWIALNSNDSAIEKSTSPEELLSNAPMGMFRTSAN